MEDWLQEPHLDPNHWLVRLAERLPWERIAEALRSFYSPKGRLAKQVRLIVGLLILKHLYDLGDRVVVEGVHENLFVHQVTELGVRIRSGFRTFVRVAKRCVLSAAKFGRDRLERVERANAQLSTMAAHVIRRAREFLPRIRARASRALKNGVKVVYRGLTRRAQQIEQTIALTERVITQNLARFAGQTVDNKVLSLHEPHVVPIKKGKQGVSAEFGTKVVLAMEPSGVVVADKVYPENVADVNTLDPMITAVERQNRKPLAELAGDRGMHHPAKDRERIGTHRVARSAIPSTGKKRALDADKPWFRRLQRFRVRIEPMIGHLKTDHRMGRSRYKGFEGDRMNVSLAVLAWNLKKMAKEIARRIDAGRGRTPAGAAAA